MNTKNISSFLPVWLDNDLKASRPRERERRKTREEKAIFTFKQPSSKSPSEGQDDTFCYVRVVFPGTFLGENRLVERRVVS
jgi:hypothetical protein